MKLYINNLIPRLKEYSKSLDKIEIFVEVPWVIVDDNLNQQKYIFKRNGDLIMSLNGQVSIGKWELLSAARSLLIDRIQDKILLNQNFIDSAVMVLKKDGFKDENLVLANEILIPDLNVTGYLKQLFYKNYKIVEISLANNKKLEIYESTSSEGQSHRSVTIESEPVHDGKYELQNSNRKYLIQDSKIVKEFVCNSYNTKKGKIVIEESYVPSLRYETPRIGDFVYQNSFPAPNGKYRIGMFDVISVENGKIVDMSMF